MAKKTDIARRKKNLFGLAIFSMAIQNGLWPISRIGNNGSFWKCNNKVKYGMPKYVWGSTWIEKKEQKQCEKCSDRFTSH